MGDGISAGHAVHRTTAQQHAHHTRPDGRVRPPMVGMWMDWPTGDADVCSEHKLTDQAFAFGQKHVIEVGEVKEDGYGAHVYAVVEQLGERVRLRVELVAPELGRPRPRGVTKQSLHLLAVPQ